MDDLYTYFYKVSANTKSFLFVSLANLHIVLCPNKMAACTELEAYSESKCFKRWVRKIMMVLKPQQGNLRLVFRLFET